MANRRSRRRDLKRHRQFCAILAVPMLREGRVIGAVTVGPAEAGLFGDMQVQLLNTFAARPFRVLACASPTKTVLLTPRSPRSP
ncbi:MAG: GAF domain-containing protein [Xanthobacteraceae bacterium]